MKKLLVPFARMSPAMVVAMAALFVALTGTAVATTSALITGNQIKNNSITGADIKNKSLKPIDFSGSVRGPRGLQGLPGAAGAKGDKGDKGDTGSTGAPGSALAYALINGDGTINQAKSKNLRAAFRFSTGNYCLDFSVTPTNTIATLYQVFGQIWSWSQPASEGALCFSPAGQFNTQVHTSDSAGAPADRAFYVVVN